MPLSRRSAPSTLQGEEIACRIPHQGSMCLLDRVIAWDDTQISCEASSHRAASNPLRAYGRLGAACGIEYAAQAMAVHGALTAEARAGNGETSQAPKPGYLASIRGLMLHVDRLDDQSGLLTIHAERLSGDDNTILYSFSLRAGPTPLLSGRAVVVLDAAGLGLTNHSGNTFDRPPDTNTARPHE